MSHKVNLSAYFERIGFAGSIAPTLPTLELIHALHPAAIPFENLSPLLGLPVSLDLKTIERKLLGERRGGYCYEHNLLLQAILADLDFPVRAIACRVLWNRPEGAEGEPSHAALLADIGGSSYLVDVGFGGLTLTAPLKLRPEAEQSTPHDTFRLTGGNPEWLLEVKSGEDWKPVYSFTTEPRSAVDFAASNAFLSEDPASPFRQQLRVSLAPQGRRLTLLDNRLTTRITGEAPEIATLDSVAALRDALSTTFGLQLPPAELLDPQLEAVLARAEPSAP